jgi:hypothetical protein
VDAVVRSIDRRLGWIVQREDGSGPTLVCEPDQYEEARHHLVRHALAADVDAVLLTVHVVQGQAYVRREVLDR